MKQPIIMMVLAASWLALPLIGRAQEAGGDDARRVTAMEDLPELTRPRARGRERIVEALEQLPEGHTLSVRLGAFYDWGHSASSDEQEPYVRSIVAVDAEGRRQGTEYAYAHNARDPIQITPWRDGHKHGTEVAYNINPRFKTAEIEWVDGRMHGVRRTFHPDGTIQSETPYHEGEQHGQAKSYAADGTVIRVSTMHEGVRHGEMIDYWASTGKPRRVLRYDRGTVQGTVREFHENGQLRREIPFVDDMMHGEETRYTADGEPERSQFWIRGDLVTRSEFELRFGS